MIALLAIGVIALLIIISRRTSNENFINRGNFYERNKKITVDKNNVCPPPKSAPKPNYK